MTKKFLYFTSMVNYRIPINPDGSCGKPEIMNKFTKETHSGKKKPTPIKITTTEIGEYYND